MMPKVLEACSKAVNFADGLANGLSPDEYRDYIEELEGHFHMLRVGLEEEESADERELERGDRD